MLIVAIGTLRRVLHLSEDKARRHLALKKREACSQSHARRPAGRQARIALGVLTPHGLRQPSGGRYDRSSSQWGGYSGWRSAAYTKITVQMAVNQSSRSIMARIPVLVDAASCGRGHPPRQRSFPTKQNRSTRVAGACDAKRAGGISLSAIVRS